MNPNWLRTVAVVAVPAGAAVAGGAVLAGPVGVVAAVAVAGLVSWLAVFLADRMALSAMRARPVGEVEYPELYRVVREVSRAARLPVPRVYVSPALQPNSFSIGRSRRTATVCCTEGLIRLLTVDELRGVMGHDLAQVRDRDTSATSLSAGLAAVITSLASPAWFLPPGRARLSFLGEPAEPAGAAEPGAPGELSGLARGAARLAMLVLGPAAALLLQLSVSPAREYQADARGAALAGDPLALAGALRKIEARTVELPLYPTGPLASASPLMIVNPFSGEGFARLFSTHPPTGERVFRL
ncbi:MAG TPA: M48 family metalloprotease, partial [Streptosporangiaceae bacterium]